jgi:hypothetical protein
MYVYD